VSRLLITLSTRNVQLRMQITRNAFGSYSFVLVHKLLIEQAEEGNQPLACLFVVEPLFLRLAPWAY
jgi:hypothetical protein